MGFSHVMHLIVGRLQREAELRLVAVLLLLLVDPLVEGGEVEAVDDGHEDRQSCTGDADAVGVPEGGTPWVGPDVAVRWIRGVFLERKGG